MQQQYLTFLYAKKPNAQERPILIIEMEADNKMSQEEYYLKGDIVFAKCEGCLPWPAKISKVLKDGYYGVKFYNHKSTATLHISSLEDFDIKRMKRYKKMHEQSAKKGYKSALIGIEEAANELARAQQKKETKDEQPLQNQSSEEVNVSSKPRDNSPEVIASSKRRSRNWRKTNFKEQPTSSNEAKKSKEFHQKLGLADNLKSDKKNTSKMDQQINAGLTLSADECEQEETKVSNYDKFCQQIAKKIPQMESYPNSSLMSTLDRILSKLVKQVERAASEEFALERKQMDQERNCLPTRKQRQLLQAILQSRRLSFDELVDSDVISKMAKFLKGFEDTTGQYRNHCYVQYIFLRSEMIKLNTIEMAKILEHPAARLDQIMGHIWVYKKNS